MIKASRATSSLLGTDGAYYSGYNYYWNNSTNNNTWSESNLNTINLNQNYLNNIGSAWASKIANATWYVGGGPRDEIAYGANSTAKNAYNYEQGSQRDGTTYNAKIGLMYLNEYYYGAGPSYWTYPGYTYSSYPDKNGNYGVSYDYRAATSNNWMYMGLIEWAISRRSDTTTYAFSLNSSGDVAAVRVYNYSSVRSVFYLNSDVELDSGAGFSSEPFRLKI